MLGAAATFGVSRAPTALVPDDAVGSTSRANLYAGHPDHGDPPSIALVVADDLGYADAGFTGAGGVAATPHLDALASAGVRLDRHYVQPICSPTRAALLTGRHVLRYGLQNAVIWPSAAWSLPRNETLMAEHLRAAGYRTAILGKWHLGMHASWALPRARGFDDAYAREPVPAYVYKRGVWFERVFAREEGARRLGSGEERDRGELRIAVGS